MERKKTNRVEKKGKISMQLLVVLIPMIAIFIVVVAAIIFTESKSIITEQAKNGLEKESKANANDISGTLNNIKGYYNGLGDNLEVSAQSEADIKEALQPGMKEYPDMVNDVYVALSDKSFIDGGDWVPADDYDPTTRGWYKTGSTSSTVIFGPPDIDMDTKEMVVNGVRAVSLPNGSQGVLSTDIFLKKLSARKALFISGRKKSSL